MNILHVIAGLNRAAGTSVFCVELCDHLQAEGVQCGIAVHSRGSNDYASRQTVPIFEAGRHLETLSFTPDLLHIHALWDPFLHRAASWAYQKGLPMVWSPHGMLTPWALRHKVAKKMLALGIYQYRDLKKAQLLHATADSEVRDARRLGLRQPVVVAPLGVHAQPHDTGGMQRRKDTRMALFVSRIHPKKGLFNLVDAWAQLRPHGWRMVVAGPDQNGHLAAVRARAEARGVADDFEFAGAIYGEAKDRLYAQADLFVLPTYSENFGVVVIEALAHGVPVITTKGAPWAELRSNRCGWWIDIGVEPLANALREAMGMSDEERYVMGANGRKLVAAKYCWPSIAEQMRTAYHWMLNGGTPPGAIQLG